MQCTTTAIANIIVHNIPAYISIIFYEKYHLMHHLVQTEHDNSLV